jgi:hypothetical protein
MSLSTAATPAATGRGTAGRCTQRRAHTATPGVLADRKLSVLDRG